MSCKSFSPSKYLCTINKKQNEFCPYTITRNHGLFFVFVILMLKKFKNVYSIDAFEIYFKNYKYMY